MSFCTRKTIKQFTIHRSKKEIVNEGVIVEHPISLSVNGSLWITLMCTPVDVDALAIGFLYNEEIIDSFKDVKDIIVHPNSHMIEIWLNKDVDKPTNWRIISGCSGGATKSNFKIPSIDKPSDNDCILQTDQIISLSKKLIEHEGLHRQVGGVHTSALSDGNDIIVICEDIGRHNSIDKVVGKTLIDNIQISRKIILTTGRISSDMLQKAARIYTSVLISLSSPTSLAIEMAKEAGVTLIGYARGRKFNVYTHPQRIVDLS